MADTSSWLPNLLGPVDLQTNGTPVSAPRRSTINLSGGEVTDDPANKRTNIAIGNGPPLRADASPAQEGDTPRRRGGIWVAEAGVEVPSGNNNDLIVLDGSGGIKNGMPASIATGDIFYYDGTKIARLPIGLNGATLQVVSGLPAWINPAFDPATLSLMGWWRADYSGSPWAGTASAGSSSGRNLSAGTAPATGTAVNGKVPASCNGSTHWLTELTLVLTSYLSASTYSIVMLVKPSAAAAPAGNIYDNKQLIANVGGPACLGIAWSTSGVKAWHETSAGATWVQSGSWATCSSGNWHMVAVTLASGTLSISVDGGAPVTIAAANVVDLAGSVWSLGKNYNSAQFTTEDVLEVMASNTDLSSNLANIKSYFNTRYALSL